MEYDFSSYENKTRDRLSELLKNDPPQYLREKIDALLASVNSLDLIGFKHGTDKASLIDDEYGVRLGHDYLRHYEFFIDRFREQSMDLIEFGCFRGQSLRMWKEYFPKAEIYGVDLDENVVQYEEERIHIIIGNATKFETFETIKNALGDRRPFVILDDASHAWSDQRMSLELFWRMLAPGGFYIVEDLECGSDGAYKNYPPEVFDSQPFFNYVQSLCSLLRWAPNRRAFVSKDLAFNQLPELIRKIQITLDACYFVPGAVILQKNPIKPPWEKD